MINYYTTKTTDLIEDMQSVASFVKEDEGLYRVDGLVNEADICKMATAITARYFAQRPLLDKPKCAIDYFKLKLGRYEQEIFFIAFLDKKYRVITCQEMFSGTIDTAAIYPREVVRMALHNNAAAVILAHNHPSGNVKPSEDDIEITRHLKESLAFFNIQLLDHIIVGGNEAASIMYAVKD